MMQASDIKGVYTALITPLKNGEIDEVKFAEFINWQIGQGVQGLVPMGTTGESPTMTADEHKKAVEICVEAAAGRVHVLAGTGSNSTAEAIEYTEHAASIGADAALVVAPYYNKPTENGLLQHFKAVHDAAEIPIIIYNVPSRVGIDMSDAVIAELAKLPRVIGVKDATGDLSRVSTLKNLINKDFAIISGEDMTAVGFNAMGGQACISVTANIVPKICADIQKHCLAGEYDLATKLHATIVDLHLAMFAESNPIPVKYAVHLLGLASDEIRLPLTKPSLAVQKNMKAAMSNLGLI